MKNLLNKISNVQRELMKCEAPVKYVETENLHCTLKFFGEIDDNKLNDVIEVIENKIKNHQSFKVNIKKQVYFQTKDMLECYGWEWKM